MRIAKAGRNGGGKLAGSSRTHSEYRNFLSCYTGVICILIYPPRFRFINTQDVTGEAERAREREREREREYESDTERDFGVLIT